MKGTTELAAVLVAFAAALTVSSAPAQAAPRGCPAEHLCVHDREYLQGRQWAFHHCGFVDGRGAAWHDRIRSFHNNQTPGTVVAFMDWTGESWTPLYRSIAPEVQLVANEAVRRADGIVVC